MLTLPAAHSGSRLQPATRAVTVGDTCWASCRCATRTLFAVVRETLLEQQHLTASQKFPQQSYVGGRAYLIGDVHQWINKIPTVLSGDDKRRVRPFQSNLFYFSKLTTLKLDHDSFRSIKNKDRHAP